MQGDGTQVLVEGIDGNKIADIVCFYKRFGNIDVFFNRILASAGKM